MVENETIDSKTSTYVLRIGVDTTPLNKRYAEKFDYESCKEYTVRELIDQMIHNKNESEIKAGLLPQFQSVKKMLGSKKLLVKVVGGKDKIGLDDKMEQYVAKKTQDKFEFNLLDLQLSDDESGGLYKRR